MSRATSETPIALAERALEQVPDGREAQATVSTERSLLLRFAHSRPTQATQVEDLTVALTVLVDGRTGTATTNRTDPNALAECAKAAVGAAESAARTGGGGTYPGLPSPSPIRDHGGYDELTARLDPEPGGAALGIAFAVAAERGVDAHGVWTVAEATTAIASSSGIRVSDRVTDAFMKVTCVAPGGRSGYASATATSVAGLAPRAVAERAAAKAALPGEPAALPAGTYPVVLEAAAVGELLAWLGFVALNGLAHAEGRGALSGRLGTRVVAPAINLSDSPRYPGTLPRAFDAEGVGKAPIPLIQDGVAHRVVHDTRSAALLGERSTGHAAEPGGSALGPEPTNLVLAGGGARDEDELCEGIERGVYVTRLWYTNVVRPKETLITGVTRDGTFLIEDGKVARPLRDLRITDSVLGLLGRTQALGARPVLTSGGEFYGRRFATGVVCPPLRVTAMRFTG